MRAAWNRWTALAVLLPMLFGPDIARGQEEPREEHQEEPSAAGAEETGPRPSFDVPELDGEIVIDGRLSEGAWQGDPTFTLDYETYPGDNVEPPVRTEMWITHDDRNLYIGVRAHDPAPEEIRARLRDRDDAFNDDFVGVVLDTFNDERRAFEFFVNPLGVQMDLTMNDVTGGEDESWDARWDSAGRVTEEGYEVEMEIPFSSLRFPPSQGPLTWGIDAIRIWPRDQRRRIGLNSLPRGRNCYLCYASKLVGFEGVKPGRNVELAPTVTAVGSWDRPGGEGDFDSSDEVEGGLTASWGITPGTTLNATLNPDFSQVEADAAQLTVNTQFALFFPEKRPFFLEGADFFQMPINAIYTRTIADPDWGLKVTGKSGPHAYGAIVAEDSRTNLLIPGSQGSRFSSLDEGNTSAILRYRRDIGDSSAVGGLVTSRDAEGYSNQVYGLDGLFRWGDGNAFRIEALGSRTEYPGSVAADLGLAAEPLDGYATRIVYQKTSREWMGYIKYNDVSPDFRADLGFIPQADFRTGFGILERYWYSDEGKHWWSRITAGLESTWTYDHDGEPLQQQVSPYFWFNGPRQSFAYVYFGHGPSWYRGRKFDRDFLYMEGEVQVVPSVYLGLQSRLGEEIDYANVQQGDLANVAPRARIELGRSLRLNLSHTWETLDVDGGRLYTANLSELRIGYQFNVRTLVRLITQYSDLERDPALYTFPVEAQSTDLFNQLLFSYKITPQTVLFLGYSDAYVANEAGFSELGQTNRTLFLKLGYAFGW